MAEIESAREAPAKPGPIGVISVNLAFAAVVLRTLAVEETRAHLPQYLGLELVYLLLFTLVLWKLNPWRRWMHVYLAVQSVLVLGLLSLRPEFDFVVVLFLLLTYQVSLVFPGRMRWIWIGILVFLTGGSLILFLGLAQGLALAPTTIAAEIVLPAFIRVNQEIAMAEAKSQALLNGLQDTHQRLLSYAGQVEELAAMEERNRLARELHDTVSQLIFGISLTTRSAQVLLEQDPARVSEQLDRLQLMSADALGQLRSLISQLRPPQKP